MNMLITGGHLTPALAFIDYVRESHPDGTIIFAGRAFSQTKTKQHSHEKEAMRQRHIPFVPVSTPRLSELKSIWGWCHIPSLIQAVVTAFRYLKSNHVEIVISFGGYLAIPWTLAATLAHVPIVTHEQTHVAGVANQWIAKWANVVAISHPDSQKFFPASKVVVTGNPIRANLSKPQPTPEWWPAENAHTSMPLLYVTGGNQGSAIINRVVGECLPELLTKYRIVHQCGNPTSVHNYQQDLMKLRAQLPLADQAHYIVQPWISETELGWLYQYADVVISRAGANTVAELSLFHIPSIFIPLPFAHQQEQLHNAQAYQATEPALILEQANFNKETLLEAVDSVQQLIVSTTKPRKVSTPNEAAAQLYQLASSLVSS